jgi:hypothetical protein
MLQASAGAAKDVSGSAKGFLGYVLSHQKDSQILPLVENAVECRTELAPQLSGDRYSASPQAKQSPAPTSALIVFPACLSRLSSEHWSACDWHGASQQQALLCL